MKNKFNKWWKVWGQIIGFMGIIIYLNVYFLALGQEMQKSKLLAAGWLASFVILCTWYAWQMKKHGWRLPKDIKDTH